MLIEARKNLYSVCKWLNRKKNLDQLISLLLEHFYFIIIFQMSTTFVTFKTPDHTIVWYLNMHMEPTITSVNILTQEKWFWVGWTINVSLTWIASSLIFKGPEPTHRFTQLISITNYFTCSVWTFSNLRQTNKVRRKSLLERS